MHKRPLTLLLTLVFVFLTAAQSLDSTVRSRADCFFNSYQSEFFLGKIKINKIEIDHELRKLKIHLNENFSYQLLRSEMVDSIYHDLRNILPGPVNYYDISIFSNNLELSELIPNHLRDKIDQNYLWGDIKYTGEPWVHNISSPNKVTKGLNNTHLFITPSHGYYYDLTKNIWKWQRPALFGTREDLLSQSFVYPYLIPMLENAGAVVYSARERDWQINSVVVDNKDLSSQYKEVNGKKNVWQSRYNGGYSTDSMRIINNDNSISVRVVETNKGKNASKATAYWIPEIPQSGEYAVYVTYQSYYNSIEKAQYTVFHKGGSTVFYVNQQIGGGTWVYLGTFLFDQGNNYHGMVVLNNNCQEAGVICADAVRFGGGMGNEQRAGVISGKPRYAEGARYYSRWAGAPDSIYLKYQGTDDYREDIQTRPRMLNYLSGNSLFNFNENGIRVPIELSFSFHTDAGVKEGDSIVGSLGIYTTLHNDGMLNSGVSRQVSRTLADMVLDGLKQDIETGSTLQWELRGLWDKDYCESREPAVPSMILELLSHQNFNDIKLAHNPNFKFLTSRSIYKSILKYVNFMHQTSYVVQPLSVRDFMIEIEKNRSLNLSWQDTPDFNNPDSKPDSYILYTKIDNQGFDNGVLLKNNYYTFNPSPNVIYSFKVTAVNSGGESFPSETLSAFIAPNSEGCALIVNGFQRLSGPAVIETDSLIGFDILEDPGVSYISSPLLCGIQKKFDKNALFNENDSALGFSDDEFDGMIVAGNSFNYPYTHGKAIAAAKNFSFTSCSRDALEKGLVNLKDYLFVDLILGLQKRSTEDSIFNKDYSTFSDPMKNQISTYCKNGGKLLVSGSYIGKDMSLNEADRDFIKNILKFEWKTSISDSNEVEVKGLNDTFKLYRKLNSEHYAATRPDIIHPTKESIPIFAYATSSYCAGVAYKGSDYSVISLGFPFEVIIDEQSREKIMRSFIKYITD
ncbi:MAG TPA: xanthan lyase [Bacteroidaceae bacterium]|nr:xanthan lyase [Bacteroidaceae bacterium]